MIIFVFFNFLAFWPFPWQRRPFWKFQDLNAPLEMGIHLPVKFSKDRIISLRILSDKFIRRGRRGRIIITRNDMIWRSLMAPNSKNYDGYQFTRTTSTWKPNVPQIGGFLYFGGHFDFKMAAIANQMMKINSQHDNLLGTQISFKSEDSKWPP